MKKKIAVLALFALVFFSLSTFSHGSGFLIYEHGAAAMAMGGAFVAIANNPTAIFHNPAGIAWLEGTQISIGTTLITSLASVNLANLGSSFDAKSQWHYPSTAYISHKISDRITAGFGFFTPYGLGLEWPNTDEKPFPLRYISTKSDMKSFFFNPTLAFKINEYLSVAVGASYIHSILKFNLTEALILAPTVIADVPATLEVTGNGWGLNAGFLYRQGSFSLGLNWRGGFKLDYKDGDLNLDLSVIQALNPAAPASLTGTGSTSFNLPHIFGLGVAFNLTEKLLIAADVDFVMWKSYDEFVVNIEVPGIEAIYPPGIDNKTIEENWKNSFVFRVGVQYTLNDNLDLRAGFLYDITPQPVETMDPILPDSDRWAVTAGFGYKFGKFVLDVAYQFEPFLDRTSPNRHIPLLIHPVTGVNLGEGTYTNTAHLIGISLGFNF
jgi:long-chain fatty acid transport protein